MNEREIISRSKIFKNNDVVPVKKYANEAPRKKEYITVQSTYFTSASSMFNTFNMVDL